MKKILKASNQDKTKRGRLENIFKMEEEFICGKWFTKYEICLTLKETMIKSINKVQWLIETLISVRAGN